MGDEGRMTQTLRPCGTEDLREGTGVAICTSMVAGALPGERPKEAKVAQEWPQEWPQQGSPPVQHLSFFLSDSTWKMYN